MKFKKPLELVVPVYGTENYYSAYVFHSGAGGYKFKTIKAVTVVISKEALDESVLGDNAGGHPYGISTCSALDEFNINTGIIKAVGRAKSKSCGLIYPENSNDAVNRVEKLAIKTAKRIDRRNKKRNTESEYVKMTFDDFKKFADSRVTFADIQDKVTFI